MSEPRHEGIKVCTSDSPWDRESRGRVHHPDARMVSSREYHDAGDEVEIYFCPHCGHEFDVEIPR